MNLNLIKIGADGNPLPSDAPEWVAVLVPAFGLMFSAASVVPRPVSQEQCIKACGELTLAGHSDWALPTAAELQLLVDRSREAPAIDVALFPTIKGGWFWTSTAAAWSSASAWYVYFYFGGVGAFHRGSNGFALAVRRVGQSSAL